MKLSKFSVFEGQQRHPPASRGALRIRHPRSPPVPQAAVFPAGRHEKGMLIIICGSQHPSHWSFSNGSSSCGIHLYIGLTIQLCDPPPLPHFPAAAAPDLRIPIHPFTAGLF